MSFDFTEIPLHGVDYTMIRPHCVIIHQFLEYHHINKKIHQTNQFFTGNLNNIKGQHDFSFFFLPKHDFSLGPSKHSIV